MPAAFHSVIRHSGLILVSGFVIRISAGGFRFRLSDSATGYLQCPREIRAPGRAELCIAKLPHRNFHWLA